MGVSTCREGAADGVRAAESHDLLVVEPHAVEHPAQVRGGVRRAVAERGLRVGQVALRGALSRLIDVPAVGPGRQCQVGVSVLGFRF